MPSPTPEQLAETYIRSKKANMFGIRNPDEVLSHMAPYSLGGAGLGALIGVLREYMSSDEKATGLNRDALETILTGALLGGGAGSGLGYFTSPMKTSAEGDEAAPAQDPAPAPAQDPAPTAYDDFMPVVDLIAPRGFDFPMLRPEDVDTALVPGTGGDPGQFYEQRVNEVVAGYGGLEGQTEVTPEQAQAGSAALKDLQAVLMRGEDRRGIASAIQNGSYVVDRSLDHPVTVVDLGGKQVRLPYTDPGTEGYGLSTQFSANAPDANIRFSSEYAAMRSAQDYVKATNLFEDLDTKDPEQVAQLNQFLDQFAQNLNFEKLYKDESTRPQALALLRNPEVGPWMQRSAQISAAYTNVTGVQGEAYRYSTPQFTSSGMADRLEITSNEAPGLGTIGLVSAAAGVGGFAAPSLVNLVPKKTELPRPQRGSVQGLTDTANRLARPITDRQSLEAAYESLTNKSLANRVGLGNPRLNPAVAGLGIPSDLLPLMQAEIAAMDNPSMASNKAVRDAYAKAFGERFPSGPMADTLDQRLARYSRVINPVGNSLAASTKKLYGSQMQEALKDPGTIRSAIKSAPTRRTLAAVGAGVPFVSMYFGRDQDKITPDQAYSTAFDDIRRRGGAGGFNDQFGSIPTTRINNPLNMLQR